MTCDEEKTQSALAAPVTQANLRARRPANYASVPVVRVHGPLNLLIDVHGNIIEPSSHLQLHCGPGKRLLPWLDYGEEW